MKWYKLIISIIVILWAVTNCYCQKNDYIWLQGYDSFGGFDSTQGLNYGNPKFDFNYSPIKITRDSLAINFLWTNTSYCDSDGNLLFYTNGTYIANSNDDTIENSDSLNWGFWLEYNDPQHGSEGYSIKEGVYALQNLTNSSQYYIIHSLVDSGGDCGGGVLCTLLDMSLNNGKGKVIYKNQFLINDKIGGSFAVTRHANGKYWWIIVQKKNTNCYYRILLDESGPHVLPDSVCAGAIYSTSDFGPMNFSQDGSRLLTLGYQAGLNVFDFDRCTGNISNPLTISYPFLVDSNWAGGGVSTSPNSRYLYVCLTYYLFQYDLWADNVPASLDTIAYFDGFSAPFYSDFFTSQNAPDGKIYISCGNSDTVYHVINNPDAKGSLCNFVQHGIHLPALSWGLPCFPNYRLGALPNSCDTTIGINEVTTSKEQIIKVYPNPANTVALVDYGFTDWSKPQPTLQICNALGQVVYLKQLPMYSALRQIDISQFAAGSYTVLIKRANAVVATNKLIVVH